MKNGNPVIWDIYCSLSVGVTLLDTPDELVKAGKVPPSVSQKVLFNYDVFVQDNIKRYGVEIRLKAKIIDYTSAKYIYRFNLKNVSITKVPSDRLSGKEVVQFKGPLHVLAVGYEASSKTTKGKVGGNN
ncbi:hypothetical protein HOY82DRAFT_600277 [Tuber indicum]|nr:hypothetical protein HOY82DRAFT_600277 [Tuber indicum]